MKPFNRAKGMLDEVLNEHRLQVMVMEHLRLRAVKDAYWFAVPNAARRSLGLAARMKKEGMRAGVADICIMLSGGRAVWVEMKTAKGRQTGQQAEFQKTCEALGHPYILAHSIDEAISGLKLHGVLR
jgi:hypothetical protein